jgi:hypothetical protein
MASFSFDPIQIFGLGDVICSWLPWQWRPFVSTWAIWRHFRDLRPGFSCTAFLSSRGSQNRLGFEKTGYRVGVGMSVAADGQRTFTVHPLLFGGENISGHSLHQVDASITLMRNQRKISLQVEFQQGGPGSQGEIEVVPPKALLNLIHRFSDDDPDFLAITSHPTIDRFLQVVGGFTLDITIDGEPIMELPV